jgi:hypothetical protein
MSCCAYVAFSASNRRDTYRRDSLHISPRIKNMKRLIRNLFITFEETVGGSMDNFGAKRVCSVWNYPLFWHSFFSSPIPSSFNYFIKDWRLRQMWLFVLCQEHSTDIIYQCWLHWHPIKITKVVDRLSHGSDIMQISWIRKRLLSADSDVHCLFTI